MFNRFSFVRWRWRNSFKSMSLYSSLLVCLLFVGIRGEQTDNLQEKHNEHSPVSPAASHGPSGGDTASWYTHIPPGQFSNWNQNSSNYANYDNQKSYRTRRYHYNRIPDYDNRQNYRQNYGENDGDPYYHPRQRHHQRRGGNRNYHRNEYSEVDGNGINNQHARRNNGNYSTYYNDYNQYTNIPPNQQYYYEPSHHQQYPAPPMEPQNYAYPPEQYYHNQPAAVPENAFAYNDPHYYQQQQYSQSFDEVPYDPNRDQHQPQVSPSKIPQSTSQKEGTSSRQSRRKKKSKPTTALHSAHSNASRRHRAKHRTSTQPVSQVPSDAPQQRHSEDKVSVQPVSQVPSDAAQQRHPKDQVSVQHVSQVPSDVPQQWDANYPQPVYNPQYHVQHPAQPFPLVQPGEPQQWDSKYGQPAYDTQHYAEQSTFPYIQSAAPHHWDLNVHPVYDPQNHNNWYHQYDPNSPPPWQPNWQPADYYYQPQQQQQQQNIDWQVLNLNSEDEVPVDLSQYGGPQPQGKHYMQTIKTTAKQETTEKNYNTFAPEELRERTRLVNDSVNYNTFSDREWAEMQGVREQSRSLEQEYMEYDTAELEKNDSKETLNYNTHESTNVTEPTEEINYNTYGPEELQKASKSPEDINYNTHGNKPYYHTDPNWPGRYYVEYPSPINNSTRRSYHSPQDQHAKYFESAKTPKFEVPSLPLSPYVNASGSKRNYHSPQARYSKYFESANTLDLQTSSTRSKIYDKKNQHKKIGGFGAFIDGMIPSKTTVEQDAYDNPNLTETFLNRWLFGHKRDRSNQPRSTFDPRSFFAGHSTSDHWLLSNHNPHNTTLATHFHYENQGKVDTDDYSSIPWLPPLYVSHSPSNYGVTGYTANPRHTPITPSDYADDSRHRINNGMRHRYHKHHHLHHSHHDQIEIEHTTPMHAYKPREFTLIRHTGSHHTARHAHKHDHANSHLDAHQKHAHQKHATNVQSVDSSSRHHRGRYARETSTVNVEDIRRRKKEEVKEGKIGKLFGFVKNVFRKITGTKKKEEDDKLTNEGETSDQRNWGRNDTRNQNYRPRHYQNRNFNNPNYQQPNNYNQNYGNRNYQNYPNPNYYPNQNYRNPNVNYNNRYNVGQYYRDPQANYNQNFNDNQNYRNPNDNVDNNEQQNNPNNDEQKNYYKRSGFHNKPFHNPDNPYNYNKPDTRNAGNNRQDDRGTYNGNSYQNNQDAPVTPPNYEDSNTRPRDQTPQQ